MHSVRIGRRQVVAGMLAALTGAAQAGAGGTTTAVAERGGAAATRPNVLVILADDQRYEGTGGAEGFLNIMPNVRTWMKQGGATFTNAFATTSLCMPSRSTLMTGRYAHNTGVLMNGNDAPETVLDQTTTLQYRLHQAGYFTAMSGKFFNTWPVAKAPPYFDQFALTKGGYWNTGFNVNGVLAGRPGYSVTVTGNYALQFLQKFHTNDPSKPWYLYVTPQAPHDPYQADTKYAKKTFAKWTGNPAVPEASKSDKPPVVQSKGTNTLAAGNTRRVSQFRTLLSVDDMVGRLMSYLQTSGQLDNTIVVYAADNGMMWSDHGLLDKRYPYSPSVHVPLFLRWPGHVAANSTWPRLVGLLDVAPTILDATGTAYDPAQIDGRNLTGAYKRSRIHLEYWKSLDAPGIPTWHGTWTPGFEYVQWYYGGDGDDDADDLAFREYYNLTGDPYQLTNLLHDGTTGNDPDVLPLQAQADADQTCAAAACP
jgi:arylsulfatase A-like enzyme